MGLSRNPTELECAIDIFLAASVPVLLLRTDRPGPKPEAVFERYNISDTEDIRDALLKVGQYVAEVEAN